MRWKEKCCGIMLYDAVSEVDEVCIILYISNEIDRRGIGYISTAQPWSLLRSIVHASEDPLYFCHPSVIPHYPSR